MAPAEVSVINGKGIVLDGERLDDVNSVRDVRWLPFAVKFQHETDGKIYESTLTLEP